MTRIMITGFEPFGTYVSNPTEQLIKEFAGRPELISEVLPVDFHLAPTRLLELATSTSPDIIVALGLAPDTTKIRLERMAANFQNAKFPDNAGNQPSGQVIDPSGPDARLSSFPWRKILDQLEGAGIPAESSLNAGSHVCNSVMYAALQYTEAHPGTIGGFIHFPPSDVLDSETANQALEIALYECDRVIFDNKKRSQQLK